jgi:hypothetical protein
MPLRRPDRSPQWRSDANIAPSYLLGFGSQMPTRPVPPPLRPWREISRELANETNRNRIIELHYELSRALDEQLFRSRKVPSTL